MADKSDGEQEKLRRELHDKTLEVGQLRIRVFNLTKDNQRLIEEKQIMKDQHAYSQRQLHTQILATGVLPSMDTNISNQQTLQCDNNKDTQIQHLKDTITTLQNQLDTSTLKSIQFDEIIRGKNVRYEQELTKQKETFEKEKVKYEKIIQKLQSQLEQSHVSSQEQVKQLREGIEALQTQIQQTTSGTMSQENLIDMTERLREENEQLQNNTYDLQEEINTLKQENTSLKYRLKQEKDKHENDYSNWTLQKAKLQGEINELCKEISDLKKSLRSFSPPHQATPQSWTTPKNKVESSSDRPHLLPKGVVNVESLLQRNNSIKGEEEKEERKTQSENVINKEFGKLQRDLVRLKQEFDKEMKAKADLERRLIEQQKFKKQ